MSHANARLTVRARRLLVRRVLPARSPVRRVKMGRLDSNAAANRRVLSDTGARRGHERGTRGPEWRSNASATLSSEMLERPADESGQLRRVLDSGSSLTGAAGGTAVGLLMGGPAGALIRCRSRVGDYGDRQGGERCSGESPFASRRDTCGSDPAPCDRGDTGAKRAAKLRMTICSRTRRAGNRPPVNSSKLRCSPRRRPTRRGRSPTWRTFSRGSSSSRI